MNLTRFALLSADGAVICGTHAPTPALLLPETTEEILIDGIRYYAAAGMGSRTRNGDRMLCASATVGASTFRRSPACVYALVLHEEGQHLTRYAYGLWPAGFPAPARVAAVLIDVGTGATTEEIRRACTCVHLDTDGMTTGIDRAVEYHIEDQVRVAAGVRGGPPTDVLEQMMADA